MLIDIYAHVEAREFAKALVNVRLKAKWAGHGAQRHSRSRFGAEPQNVQLTDRLCGMCLADFAAQSTRNLQQSFRIN